VSQPWQKQVIQLSRLAGAFGQQLNFLCTQDSYIEELLIGVEGTIGTAAATAAIEGLSAIIQNVRVTGTLSSTGQNLNPINNVRGPQLLELAQFIRANVSYSFGALGTAAAFGIYVPSTFSYFRMGGALTYMSVLPANSMGSVSVNITVANQNQLDTNATPTLAFTTLSVFVQQNQFMATSLPAAGKWQYIPNTVDQLVRTNITTTVFQEQFPNGAAYLNILVRSFTTTVAATGVATARQTDGTAGPIDTSTTSAGLTLLDVNLKPKKAVDWYSLRKENLDNITDSLVAGNGCFQFNRGIQDVWMPTIGPNYIPLQVGYVATTNSKVEYVYQRLYDDLTVNNGHGYLNLV
jgi:hypothetical protein